MDNVVKSPNQRVNFSVLGADLVEWLIVCLLCAVATAGVAVMTGSVVSAAVVGVVVFIASAAVVALL
ncbi:hypothetical protein [Antrihabitans stalactiti]|uniref:Uncharacterized protein n=1 Tax=Antrihabitans stalactiti TaxID=2584121 RepID=A0A848KAP7_9NOCA|nr:hypothetical protein [Antrihabitans stalactiti]NMN95421.1 hypothetical protein [Antrihabitans stalactiti]